MSERKSSATEPAKRTLRKLHIMLCAGFSIVGLASWQGLVWSRHNDHWNLVGLFALSLVLCPGLRAQSSSTTSLPAANVATKSNDDEPSWVRAWLHRVDEARASQPHFVAPIVTTHVMLVQQYRYDMSWQRDPSGGTVTSNYGASRGLEIIPATRFEVGIS